ncbi:hypothetical protein CsSME_00018169 [Camellia sinensis var. sinensis]
MSQDSQEITTVEQWRWSEMHGLELMLPPPTTAARDTERKVFEERELGEEKGNMGEERREMEAALAVKKYGSALPSTRYVELFGFAMAAAVALLFCSLCPQL